MNIDDILSRQEFREIDDFLNQEMLSSAGDFLVGRMLEVFEDDSKVRNWFYSELKVLDNQRPYDYCLDGREYEVEQLLGRIEYGLIS